MLIYTPKCTLCTVYTPIHSISFCEHCCYYRFQSHACIMMATHHWRWCHGNLTWWNLKLEMVKTIGTSRKINAILLNIKLNQPKLVDKCGYEMATNQQNFTEIYLAYVELSQKVLGGYFFDSHCSRVLWPIDFITIGLRHIEITELNSNTLPRDQKRAPFEYGCQKFGGSLSLNRGTPKYLFVGGFTTYLCEYFQKEARYRQLATPLQTIKGPYILPKFGELCPAAIYSRFLTHCHGSLYDDFQISHGGHWTELNQTLPHVWKWKWKSKIWGFSPLKRGATKCLFSSGFTTGKGENGYVNYEVSPANPQNSVIMFGPHTAEI